MKGSDQRLEGTHLHFPVFATLVFVLLSVNMTITDKADAYSDRHMTSAPSPPTDLILEIPILSLFGIYLNVPFPHISSCGLY